jgi:arylsulfatase A-like enzyme
MKYLKCILIILLGAVFSGCSVEKSEDINEQPNVLFIMCDDLNDYSGTFGGHPQIKTPNIDKLASAATIFTNAHTNVPVCQPSRNSLFTGVYPHASKDFGWTPRNKQHILKNNKTFLELFGENGYNMLGTGKLMHHNVLSFWDEWGVDERINYGPHAYNGDKPVGHPSIPQPFRGINFVDGSFGPLSNTPVFSEEEIGADEPGWTYGNKPFKYINDDDRDLMPDEMHARWVADKIKELDALENDQPFFIGVGFVKPHTPLYAPRKYFDMFPINQIRLPEILDGDTDDCYYSSVYPPSEMGLHYYEALKASFPNGDEGLKLFLQAYMACVAFVDDQVGVVLEALNNSRFQDNTIVILTSDHGWQMGEKNYLYKNSPWEESTRIPLIIKAPGLSDPGSKVDHPVSLIDMYPTLIELCHLKGKTGYDPSAVELQGFSLQPFLKDVNFNTWEGPDGALTLLGAGINQPIEGVGISKNRSALWHIEIIKELDDSYVMQQNYTYRTKEWRYIRYHNGKEELYNHKNDPNEWHNLAEADAYDEIRIGLRTKLMEMIN